MSDVCDAVNDRGTVAHSEVESCGYEGEGGEHDHGEPGLAEHQPTLGQVTGHTTQDGDCKLWPRSQLRGHGGDTGDWGHCMWLHYRTAPPHHSPPYQLIYTSLKFSCGWEEVRKVITLDNMYYVCIVCRFELQWWNLIFRQYVVDLVKKINWGHSSLPYISHLIAAFNVLSAAATLRQKRTNHETDEEYHFCSTGVNLQ